MIKKCCESCKYYDDGCCTNGQTFGYASVIDINSVINIAQEDIETLINNLNIDIGIKNPSTFYCSEWL